MKKLAILLLALTSLSLLSVSAQTKPSEMPLYEGKIPNEKPGPNEEKSETDGILRISKVRNPTLTAYLPPKEKATGAAVVICPGGGYSILAAAHEGADVARKFNEHGIAAFVVKYRLPDANISTNPEISPLQDAQQAIRVVRKRATEWQIDPQRIGIIGFSAGGHLASTAGTHFQKAVIPNPDNISVRPDFMILVYPVISSQPGVAHAGSFEKLLGKNASPEKLKEYSNDQQITAQTPPTFLVHASDDKVVPPNNSILFYQALQLQNIPAELHIYPKGGHGFGLKNPTTPDYWFDRCLNWMMASNFIKNTTVK
ncbi:alpha/beta hydrolase [Adhaeribacter pallidiroseus]|uniref:Endo-1,4-beta-xylanase n=1 Tax=Adhaeribacter pallidiroseus TaxID=2072847 RepID=A0A369QB18_9BACT|nr:alpha/beta hydrolase [Adhaeribacter pallidiroseus]RDC61520.1 Endo-1,4-beta-xylanase [Adhaeribacter pallidiroseus]